MLFGGTWNSEAGARKKRKEARAESCTPRDSETRRRERGGRGDRRTQFHIYLSGFACLFGKYP